MQFDVMLKKPFLHRAVLTLVHRRHAYLSAMPQLLMSATVDSGFPLRLPAAAS
jgi:hypothetical protein